jgi:xanthine/uracil permease|tara:strand:- start:843 stop:1247 length:405 start_codon:yes stop_codon:yes gene_type:complete
MSDEKLMKEYRGPSRQYPTIERKYFIRIFAGLMIILLGVVGQQINVELSETTVLVPGPDPGAGPSEVSSGIDVTRTGGMLAMLVGSVINLRAITTYREEYGEIKDTEKRPEMLFILGAIILTIAAIGLAGSLII